MTLLLAASADMDDMMNVVFPPGSVNGAMKCVSIVIENADPMGDPEIFTVTLTTASSVILTQSTTDIIITDSNGMDIESMHLPLVCSSCSCCSVNISCTKCERRGVSIGMCYNIWFQWSNSKNCQCNVSHYYWHRYSTVIVKSLSQWVVLM